MSVEQAILNGDMDTIMSYHNNGYVWETSDIRLSIDIGNLDMVKFFIKEVGTAGLNSNDFCNATRNSVELVDFLYTNGVRMTKSERDNIEDAFMTAIGNESLEMFKYLVSKGYEPTDMIFREAAFRGDEDIIKFIYKSGFPSSLDVCIDAIDNNNTWLTKKLIREHSYQYYMIVMRGLNSSNEEIRQIIHNCYTSSWHIYSQLTSECHYCKNNITKVMNKMYTFDNNMVCWLTRSLLDSITL